MSGSGLIMEGGAMRGMFTAGVTDVWMEEGVHFDGAVGVSAGAAFGVNVKSCQPGRVIRYNLRFAGDPRYASLRSLLLTGNYYGARFCYHAIPERLDRFDKKTFAQNPMSFYVVCTDVSTGKALYHRIDHGDKTDLEWVRASASMPIFSRPVRIGEYRLLDGGISDSIPLRFFEYLGYEKNVVILTQPQGYRKKKSAATPLIARVISQYPAVGERLLGRAQAYNEQVDYVREREAQGAAFVVCPPRALPMKRTESDPAKLQEAYEIGRREGRRVLPALRRYLGQA